LKQLSIGGFGHGRIGKRSFANEAVRSEATKPHEIGPNASTKEFVSSPIKPKATAIGGFGHGRMVKTVSNPLGSTEIGVNVSKSKEMLSNGSKPQETGLIASKSNGIVSIASKPNENGPTSSATTSNSFQLSQMVGNQKISVTPVFSFTFIYLSKFYPILAKFYGMPLTFASCRPSAQYGAATVADHASRP
jgi:hypothetical protein